MKYLSSLLIALCLVAAPATFTGCKTQKLEAGGAYAPTNQFGVVIYNDIGLALFDASHKLAYDTITTVFKFERDNRAVLWAISPDIKKSLDKVRVEANQAEIKWATTRKLYRQNPTPAGLSQLQTILSEIHRISLVAQQQMATANNNVPLP